MCEMEGSFLEFFNGEEILVRVVRKGLLVYLHYTLPQHESIVRNAIAQPNIVLFLLLVQHPQSSNEVVLRLTLDPQLP